MLSAFSETLHCMFPYLRKTVKFVAYIIISLTHKVLFYSSKLMTTIFRCDALNVVFSCFTLIIGLMYVRRKTTLWPYSNFIVILYKRFNNVPPSLFMELWEQRFKRRRRGGWVFNNENFVWRVSNFEWNDQLRGYISAELPRAKLLWWTWEDGILAKITGLKSLL